MKGELGLVRERGKGGDGKVETSWGAVMEMGRFGRWRLGWRGESLRLKRLCLGLPMSHHCRRIW